MTRAGLAVVALVAAAALPGCGGQDDDQVTGRPRPSPSAAGKTVARSGNAPIKREFVRKADAVCADAKRRAAPISAAVDEGIANEDAAGVAAELRKGLAIADAFLGRIRALTPPQGDERIVGQYIDIVAEQRRRMPPLVEALEAEDISTIEVLAKELRQGNRSAERLARVYGLTKCGLRGLPDD